jgi:TetR/AcrR family transcriptional regulator, repressor for uid operon
MANRMMSSPAETVPTSNDLRQTRILDAAHACFARSGFHRTTMADIAAEAGMSAGNLYRYFASKDAVVAQLCARDRADIASGFAGINEATDPVTAFEALGRHHLVNEPRERAVLVAEIWAEAARNGTIAKMCSDFDADITSRLDDFIGALRTRALVHPDVDTRELAALVAVLVDGVISRRARDPQFDTAPFVQHISSLVMAGASGSLASLLKATSGGPPQSHHMPKGPAQ